jgi:hypothetical protein
MQMCDFKSLGTMGLANGCSFEDNGVSIGRKKCSPWPAGTGITKI